MQPDQELRAYELLQWVPYSLPSDYDEALALQGHYSRLQRQRSNEAFAAWDKANPSKPSEELAAFRELERIGIYTQLDFFSPPKAKRGYYTKRLREHNAQASGSARGTGSTGTPLAARRYRGREHRRAR